MMIKLLLLVLLVGISIPLVICILKAGEYLEYVKPLDKNEFMGCSYYGIGFAMSDLLKIDFGTDEAHKIREQAGVLYGRRYADYYLHVLYAQAFTYAFLIGYILMFIGAIATGIEGVMLSMMGVVGAVIVYKFYLKNYQNKLEKLNVKYMMDFPNAVSTIALLVNGGMLLRDAWKQVAYSSDTPLYMQMRGVTEDMANGVSESDAIFAFANRCSTKEIRKFSTLIIQAIEKGGRDLADSLVKQSDLLIHEKRNLVLQEGEKASNKLMIPIALIFIGVLVIVMLPIMANMNV